MLITLKTIEEYEFGIMKANIGSKLFALYEIIFDITLLFLIEFLNSSGIGLCQEVTNDYFEKSRLVNQHVDLYHDKSLSAKGKKALLHSFVF